MGKFILTFQCADAPGIVKTASNAIFERDGNILENDQFTDPVTGQFCMRTRFEATNHELLELQSHIGAALAPFAPTLTLRDEVSPRKVIIMASRQDHCLADLLYRREQGELGVEIVAVISNHRDCQALVERHGTPFHYFDVTSESKSTVESEILALVQNYHSDFVVLARYMQILSAQMCAALPGRIINIHHSFLPGFKGAKPYHQAYERGVKLIGATAHFVTSDLDEGPIIDQDVVRVSHAREPRELVALGRDIERIVLARAVQLLAEDRVALVGRRTVIFSQ